MKSLLIIDDHPVYRDALSEKLAFEFRPEGMRVAAVGCVQEGLELIQNTHTPWVILLDILMPGPGLSGLAAIKVLKELPTVEHIVAISGLDEHVWEPKTVSAGASLFLSKNGTADFMIRKLRPLIHLPTPATVNGQDHEAKEFRLTHRQLEVLGLVAQGHPNQMIAKHLDISEQTVKIHITQIFKELRVFNRTQAVLKAQKHQLLP
jgi:DNA-binding NarL/FixJ family response regulator